MNIQFTDYRRFIASIGLALIVLSVTLPWLVLKEPLLVDIKATDLSQLTTLGQYNVHLRQFMSLSLSVLACCISPMFFFTGIFFVIIGVPLWMLRETQEERQESESRKIKQDIDKIELDGKKDNDIQFIKGREYVLRQILKSRIENSFPAEYCLIRENQVIENSRWGQAYDFIIHFPTAISPDILIKVKYTMSDKNFKLLELYFVLLLSALKNHPIPARAVGVVLHEQSAYHKSNFRFLKNNLFKRPDMDFYDLSEQEINVISTEEFLKFFFPAGIPWKDKNQ